MRLRLLLAVVAVPVVLWLTLPIPSSGQSARISSLHDKISKKRAQVGRTKARERVLASEVAGYSRRIASLQSDISELQRKQVRLQADLDAKRRQLAAVQERLRRERARLARLRARLAEARAALAKRLLDLYKADDPDVVTVVLEADGFADLLTRTEFMERVSHQDARILDTVRRAKADAKRTAARLETLERRQKAVAASVQARRDEVARVRGRLTEQRDAYAAVRSRKHTVLSSVREHRHDLEGDLASLEREQARVAAALQRSAASNGYNPAVAGPVRAGSGGLIWPVNGPLTSPFGMRWGRLHAGVDISAPEGTPIRAAASGRVALAGWMGGYGQYTCIQHAGPLSTCYAHQSRIGTSVGASVRRGQVIGAVGNTGNSFGAHLHFETRVNGNPVNPAAYL